MSRLSLRCGVAVLCVCVACTPDPTSLRTASTTRDIGRPVADLSGPCPGCVFGPELFQRLPSEPGTAIRTFTAPAGSGATVRVIPLGDLRAVGWIWLGTDLLVEPEDFERAGGRIMDRRVTLASSNTLVVRLAGRPESGVTIEVRLDTPPQASCGTAMELFPAELVDPASLSSLRPLGEVNPPGHVFPKRHMDWHARFDATPSPIEFAVTAPSPGRIVAIRYGERLSNGVTSFDYTLFFRPCEEVTMYLGHVTRLDDAITAALGDQASLSWMDFFGERLRLAAYDVPTGTVLGYAGRPNWTNLDVGLVDDRRPVLAFANVSRYELPTSLPPGVVLPDGFTLDKLRDVSGQPAHQFCALDYFPSSLRLAYEALLTRTVDPVCNTHMQDVPGTLAGNWFPAPTGRDSDLEPFSVSFAPDASDPSEQIIAFGTGIDAILDGQAALVPQRTASTPPAINRVFRDVLAGDPLAACFSGLTGRNGTPTPTVLDRAVWATVSPDGLQLTLSIRSTHLCGSDVVSERTFYR